MIYKEKEGRGGGPGSGAAGGGETLTHRAKREGAGPFTCV